VCGAISKFITVFITDFNLAQSNFVKNIKKGFMKSNPKKPKYSTMWNPDLLIGNYQRINPKKLLISIFISKSCYQETWSS
jgi:hypothetical protein